MKRNVIRTMDRGLLLTVVFGFEGVMDEWIVLHFFPGIYQGPRELFLYVTGPSKVTVPVILI